MNESQSITFTHKNLAEITRLNKIISRFLSFLLLISMAILILSIMLTDGFAQIVFVAVFIGIQYFFLKRTMRKKEKLEAETNIDLHTFFRHTAKVTIPEDTDIFEDTNIFEQERIGLSESEDANVTYARWSIERFDEKFILTPTQN